MAQPTRILFVTGEAHPFAAASSIADLARTLPEHLNEAGDFDARIMMPCYGSISEREHSLHEVIRLSGTEVHMVDGAEELTVKVASVPGVRLQVYFMDHADLFNRDGLSHDADGVPFDDNLDRAIFFGRAVLETISKLRWGPAIIHSLGWISGLVPLLLATDYADDELLGDTKSVYTPDAVDAGVHLSPEVASAAGLSLDADDEPTPAEVGRRFATSTIFPPDLDPSDDAEQFGDDEEARIEQLLAVYEQMLNEVPA